MKSLTTLYKIGMGPSSSHTIGPNNAARLMAARYPMADRVEVTLYGSLADTGKGHGIENAILSALPTASIRFDHQEEKLTHPNTMRFKVFQKEKELADTVIVSIGGGRIVIPGDTSLNDTEAEKEVYPEKNMTAILDYCDQNHLSLVEYALRREAEAFPERDFKAYMKEIWHAMTQSVENGLKAEGYLPGPLQIERKAGLLSRMRCYNESLDITQERTISSYAYAVSEENACGGLIVTAPTCGSAGVIPAVFYNMQKECGYPEEEIIDALIVAGLIGNVIRTNASISGAECGCQAEIGSACSMAAAGLAYLEKLSPAQIEYAAEVAMEHHLGLTCDPVACLVQIPCIERNAVAAMRARNAVNLARFLFSTRKISFDTVVETMYRTGKDLLDKYRETSYGGLAESYK